MTEITLAFALPLLGAFLLPLVYRALPTALAGLTGPALLLVSAGLLLAAWTGYQQAIVIAFGNFAPPLGIAFYADRLALLFALAVPLATLLLWPGGDDDAAVRRQTLTLVLAASLIGMALSGDLFNLFVFYELAAVASYGLVTHDRGGAGYLAAFRYLLISALGSVIALVGIALIYFRTGTLNLADLAGMQHLLGDGIGLAAFAMLVIGFGVKAELFPVNGWVPEVYAAAPKRVSALLAGLASKLAVLVIVRIMLLVFPGEEARQLLLLLGIAGVVLGELAAWQARDVTRMLAWSSVAQLGIVFIAFSVPGEAGVIAGVVVALHHLLIKSALFLLAESWGGAIERLRGAARTSPLAALLFTLCALSLLGLPPLPGFWSKFLVIGALADGAGGLQLAAIATVLTATVVEGGYLLRAVATLYARPAGDTPLPDAHRAANLVPAGLFAAILAAAVIFINPLWSGLSELAAGATDTAAYRASVLPEGRP